MPTPVRSTLEHRANGLHEERSLATEQARCAGDTIDGNSSLMVQAAYRNVFPEDLPHAHDALRIKKTSPKNLVKNLNDQNTFSDHHKKDAPWKTDAGI